MKKLSIISTSRLCASLLVALAFANGPSAHAAGVYQQHNLVANVAETADFTDPNLVNPWGVAFHPFGRAWVANNGTGVSTLYNGIGTPNSLVVEVPSASEPTGGNPTGIVFNGSPEFVVSVDGVSGSSRFIFATEEGVIAGWSPTVDPTRAIRVIGTTTDGETPEDGPVYKGLALSANGTGSRLYAADFRNNKVDVFDGSFEPVTLATGAFTDPDLPEGFAPFGIQAINGSIYVAYAMQDENQQDDVKGEGLGFVSVFNPDGEFIKRIASEGTLNAPWGMALAPADFGEASSRLLVGNFGDGTINAYDLATGEFIGQLTDASGSLIEIDGLWGLAFGNGFANQPVNTLFFSAGPNDEQGGLYGSIEAQNGGTNGQTGTNGTPNGGTNGQTGTNGTQTGGTNGQTATNGTQTGISQ
ncbi:MAG: TIGR03118 family protein [Methylobacter sp.]|uniref:TIGR03118 family protein n=1 Tax=Methylobacter sp. TaxID=2051955 RepID=UPI00272F46BA|nr:TIGR03118 family protein [Methylobacter sp.]MDP1667395.1 TIGR03118 family protein [Methylobacter sp.]